MAGIRYYESGDAWLVLARLADMALRRRAAVDFKLENPRMRSDQEFRTGNRKFSITVSIANEAATLEAFRPIANEEREALGERMCSQWGERFELLQAGPPPGPTADVIEVFNSGECPTCGSPATLACRPVHAGERDAGNWAHPARAHNGSVEMRPHPDALQLAATQLRREPGSLFRDARLTEMQRRTVAILSTAVIAYARHDARSQALGAATAEEIDHRLRDITSHPNPRSTGRLEPWTFNEEIQNYPETDAQDTIDATLYQRMLGRVDASLATGEELDRLAEAVGIRRHGSTYPRRQDETDAELRDRVLDTMRPRRARAQAGMIRQCNDCGVLHDARLACDDRQRARFQISRTIDINPNALRDIIGAGPGTSKRCTCHTTADQHARECALATKPEPKETK